MPTEYLESEIEIQPGNGGIYSFSFGAPGGDARGTLKLPTSDPAVQALLQQLASLNTDEEMLAQLGQSLFEALFQGRVKEVYTRTQGFLRGSTGLRLKFNIAATESEVAALPWEFLHDPDQGPLALLDISVVRYLPQQAVIPHLQAELPLKMLLTGAQPSNLNPVDVVREIENVQSALAGLAEQRTVQIDVEPHLTRSKLQQLLRRGYHIWHFVGHGGFGRDGVTGKLFLEDSAGSGDGVSAQELKILLRGSSVRLILLDACEGAKLATDPFRSLAPALINAMVPAVIAMQFEFGQESSQAFAGEFYRALAEGLPIDACVTEGRKAIMGTTGLRNPDWGIPVVYTRAPDGKLFDLPKAAPATPQPGGQAGTNINFGSGNTLGAGSSVNVSNVGSQNTSDSTIFQGADPDEDLKNSLRTLIGQKKRRLYALQLMAARTGINTQPEVSTEIEDLEGRKDYRGNIIAPGEIAKLEQQLKDLGG